MLTVDVNLVEYIAMKVRSFLLMVMFTAGVCNSGYAQVLTEKQVSELQTKWEDQRVGKRITFSATFARRPIDTRVDGGKLRNYIKSGKIPFRITASCCEYIKSGAGEKKFGVRDAVKIYILDSNGTVVFNTQKPLADMAGT